MGARTADIAAEVLFCVLVCAFILAMSPILIALLLFSRKYKNPN
jgi:hypothetical protein